MVLNSPPFVEVAQVCVILDQLETRYYPCKDDPPPLRTPFSLALKCFC